MIPRHVTSEGDDVFKDLEVPVPGPDAVADAEREIPNARAIPLGKTQGQRDDFQIVVQFLKSGDQDDHRSGKRRTLCPTGHIVLCPRWTLFRLF